ncbi:DUF3326 domain-containing protein [Dolichospermum circinale]|uniref:DUF3326 domain-containing protein n=1 Tax=Dolichospermum circinale TaxID=109265 RepID=UPI0004878EA1|nr:DUF3326 domain-containing protein [Dolichospermum circinale]MDB9467085.1 DUF3326 domain-containing protein [Dolichospermum circinale CS-539/09]MDB9469101.1 DUF3326 domain-containing protein [Dolichospermum circinale CS-539]
MQKPYTVILIIPTGIGAAIGGYAGDALPVARIISQVCDRLITHPNVMNGASLYWNIPNAFYVEGYGLDKFAAGEWGLRPVRSNRVGLLLDQGIEPELMRRHLQVADAARATLGLDITNHVITDADLNVELRISSSGTSWGTIGNPDSLLRAAEKLIIQEKAQAIAVVTRFPEDMDETALQNYRQGEGVDPLAGAEAVISHLLVRTFKIPCAHAPALSPAPTVSNLSPRAAAEELGYTFLPCVLVGLSNAPQFIINTESYKPLSTDLWADQIDALIIPDTSCGGSALLSLSKSQCQIITVTENKTLLQVSAPMLKIPTLQVNSYLEAVGVLVAHKAGINPFSLMI